MFTIFIVSSAALALLLMAYLYRRANGELTRQKFALKHVLEAQRFANFESLGEDKIMGEIIQYAMNITQANGAVLEVVDGEEMVYRYAGGLASDFKGMRLKRVGSFSGLCVTEGRALVCQDSESDKRVDREACRRVNVRSMIVTPLMHENKVVAVLKVYSSERDKFAQAELQTLELIGGILASALARASAQQQLLEAKDHAVAATRTKSLFLANMSHEIRTPLNGILGMARLLMETPLDAEQKEFASDIFQSGDALLRLVNDILDFSKVEAGKLEFEKIDFNLPALLRDLEKTLMPVCAEKGLRFEPTFDSKLPAHFVGDSNRLRQILVNLLGNAIKFTSEGFVKIGVELVSEDLTAVKICFRVADSGVGIPAEALPSLFDEFTQADISTTRRFGGTGLGLAICKQLVERMDGQIGVRSGPGEGTLFWFTLQLARGVAKESAFPSTENTDFRVDGVIRRRVLVADDNRVNRKIAVKSLEHFGVQVDIAGNGREVLELLEAGKAYDLILMDCQMPEMDGYEATQTIRRANNRIPIIAMTANAMPEDAERCRLVGMDDYLSKPFAQKDLAKILSRWFTIIDARGA